jgi:hypothetical protein
MKLNKEDVSNSTSFPGNGPKPKIGKQMAKSEVKLLLK